MKIAISTESSADLSQEVLDKFGIKTTPLTITLGEDSYLDGTFPISKIFDYVNKNKELPRTSAVNEYQFTEYFENLLKEYDAVVHLSMSSKVSCTCSNAVAASQKFDNVFVVDTLSLCGGMALLCIYAQKINNGTLTPQEIVDKVTEKLSKVRVNFVVNKLDYLKHGGRCNFLQLLGANLLKIRPTISMINGKTTSGKKYIGPLDVSYKKMLEDVLKDKDPDKSAVVIPYTTIDEKSLAYAKNFVKQRGFEEVYELQTNSTIASHCGELAMGLIFIEK